MGKINEIVADGVTVKILEERAAAFVDREKQTFSRYAELFPNYEWTDSATAIDFMAAEIKCLRFELLDACRLATSMREFALPKYATTRTAEWGNWKKLCARLTALLRRRRGREPGFSRAQAVTPTVSSPAVRPTSRIGFVTLQDVLDSRAWRSRLSAAISASRSAMRR